MSQSTNIPATDSAEAQQPEPGATGDQGISLSDLPSPPPATDETEENLSAPAKEPTKENSLIRSRTWMSDSKMAVAGWIVALLSFLVAVIAMVPSFRSESMSQRALDLAEWTALKDFIENCKQDHQVGMASIACQEAITQPLPAPPHVQITSSTIKRRTDNGCNCKKRDASLSLCVNIDRTIILTSYIVLTALYLVILRIRYTKPLKGNCVENNRSRAEIFSEQISEISYYEMTSFDENERLGTQIAEDQSERRFECVSRAVRAHFDRTETFGQGRLDKAPWPQGSHASIAIMIKSTSYAQSKQMVWIHGLFNSLFGFLIFMLAITIE